MKDRLQSVQSGEYQEVDAVKQRTLRHQRIRFKSSKTTPSRAIKSNGSPRSTLLNAGSLTKMDDILLYRQFYRETDKMKCLQVLSHPQFNYQFISAHHARAERFRVLPRVSGDGWKTVFPEMAARIARLINHCENCIETQRTHIKFMTSWLAPVINNQKFDSEHSG